MAIGQQIRSAIQRARGYWADLTDASGKRAQTDREEREDAVHQRYGGVRSQGERDAEQRFQERQEQSQDRGTPDSVMANPAARAARSGQGGQPGGQSRRNNPVQAGNPRAQAGSAGGGQTSRQYTQQGGSGIQKSLGEQLGDDNSRPTAPGATGGSGGPGQRG